MERTKGVKNVMSEDKDQTTQDNQALTMPWIVLSNQIQSMERNFNQRLDDFKDTVNTRLDGMDKRLDGMDKRLDGMDKRLDGLEGRLANRMNAWMAVVMMVLTALLGFLLAHVKL